MRSPTARILDVQRARIAERKHDLGTKVFGPLVSPALKVTLLRRLPEWPFRSAKSPWPEYTRPVPDSLKTVPGIWRDPGAEAEAFSKSPVYYFWKLYSDVWGPSLLAYGWAHLLPSLPRRLRVMTQVSSEPAPETHSPPPVDDPQALTDELRAFADELGMSQIGFAPFDPKYVFNRTASDVAENGYTSPVSEGSVIVCLGEQDWKASQTAPSSEAERAIQRAYSDVAAKAKAVAEYLRAKGYQAQFQGPGGHLVSIHFAVEAGLGQLGLNGQLLTPHVGSRCRIMCITTNATLVHGKPRDFGIHKVCDECKACVRRCPPGAIPAKRFDHRGLVKARIKPERCLPVTAQAHGCAICMKVCPIQRYGLQAVTDHFESTGTILGKGTDELEGYKWLDGRHYGPGKKPRITKEFLRPQGIFVDPHRVEPPEGAPPPPGVPGKRW